MEPLEAPLSALREEGSVLVVCPECEYRLLVVVADAAPE